jgi:hypothetical protein
VALVFVAGNAADVFAPDLAAAIDAELRTRFPSLRIVDGDAYQSDPVDAAGWTQLQARAMRLISAPHLGGLDAAKSSAGAPSGNSGRRSGATRRAKRTVGRSEQAGSEVLAPVPVRH